MDTTISQEHIFDASDTWDKETSENVKTQFWILASTDIHDAIALDKENNNTKWEESIKKEIGGIKEHNTFKLLPPSSEPPEGYQEGPLKIIFSV